MIGKFNNIKIQGIQAAVPKNIIDNQMFAEQFGEKKLKRLLSTIGVYKRHILDKGQSITDLAVASADLLIEKVKWNRNDIRVLVYVTQTPEFESPSTAMLIQKRLKIGMDCIAFDVNLGCSGYAAGLQIVSSLLQNCDDGSKGLLLVGDGAILERKEPSDAMLFGDGAAATAVEKVEHSTPVYFMQNTDGNRYDVLLRCNNEAVYMDGEAVFNFSMNEVTASIRKCKEYFGVEEDSIHYYVLHQAQKFLVKNVADLCGIPEEKLLYSLEEYGNTSCVSLPLTLCHNDMKLMDKGKVKLYLCGFGVGLAWGSIICEVETNKIFPVLLCE